MGGNGGAEGTGERHDTANRQFGYQSDLHDVKRRRHPELGRRLLLDEQRRMEWKTRPADAPRILAFLVVRSLESARRRRSRRDVPRYRIRRWRPGLDPAGDLDLFLRHVLLRRAGAYRRLMGCRLRHLD